jgi:hypothetical protein
LTIVDDYGRCDGRASVLTGSCFAIWNEKHPDDVIDLQQVEQMLQQLAASKLCIIYDADGGKRVLQLTQWNERIRVGTISKFPPCSNLQQHDINLLPPSPSPSNPTPSPYRQTPAGAVEAFDEFWKTYPRKVGKSAAMKSFVRLGCHRMMDRIMPAIERAKKSFDWIKDNGQYIPHPTTWLNQGRWDDELQISGEPPKKTKSENDVWSVGRGLFTLTRAPERKDFQDDSSYEGHLQSYNSWKAKRLTEKAREKL